MKKFIYRLNVKLAALLIALPCMVLSELETWEQLDGTAFDAEIVKVFATEVLFKDADGKSFKVPKSSFSKDSQVRFELADPPAIKIEFVKLIEKKNFNAPFITEQAIRPPEHRGRFGIRIKQTSTGEYKHELNVEVFVIGEERLGGKYILLDHFDGKFKLTRANDQEFELMSEREVKLRGYIVDENPRGETWKSYLAIVTDSRGKVIAYKTPNEWLMEHYENLSMLKPRNYMDKTCTRVYPSRPPVYSGH